MNEIWKGKHKSKEQRSVLKKYQWWCMIYLYDAWEAAIKSFNDYSLIQSRANFFFFFLDVYRDRDNTYFNSS